MLCHHQNPFRFAFLCQHYYLCFVFIFLCSSLFILHCCDSLWNAAGDRARSKCAAKPFRSAHDTLICVLAHGCSINETLHFHKNKKRQVVCERRERRESRFVTYCNESPRDTLTWRGRNRLDKLCNYPFQNTCPSIFIYNIYADISVSMIGEYKPKILANWYISYFHLVLV